MESSRQTTFGSTSLNLSADDGTGIRNIGKTAHAQMEEEIRALQEKVSELKQEIGKLKQNDGPLSLEQDSADDIECSSWGWLDS